MRSLERLEPRHVLAASLMVTFAAMRTWLHVNPDTDLNVGPYNVHHLFTGVLMLTACGIPLVLRGPAGPAGLLLLAGFGAGLSMVLDEWVYLIVTDGSNAAYVRMPSLAGGAVLVGATAVYALRAGAARTVPNAALDPVSVGKDHGDRAIAVPAAPPRDSRSGTE
jgi:hypothetical protein